MDTIETDYLVIGGGAAGMAFVDTLIAESGAQVLMVDRRGLPGGHWNDAYRFVTLHQPSAFYGVNSRALGSGRKDTTGLNQGMYELASGAEICHYYERVLHDHLLPSGRVAWRPMTEVVAQDAGGAVLASVLTGARTRVVVRKRIVDARYLSPAVPATHRPRFAVAEGVRLVPPNALPALTAPPGRIVVLGAGKTAMDTLIWLLGQGVGPDQLQWVMPRDSWLINRLTTQSGPEFFFEAIGGQASQLEAMAQATSTEDLFLRLEACGAMLRIDPARGPTMFHFATLSEGELAVLRRVHDVVRLGRVQALTAGEMQLDQGRVPVAPDTLFVDCTASAVEPRPVQPVFQPGRIVLQIVRMPLPTFSAALIAWIEAHRDDDAARNALCAPAPFPTSLAGYAPAMAVHFWNQFQWSQDKALRDWIRASRLDGFGHLMAGIDRGDAAKQAVLARLKTAAPAATANLQRLARSH